MPTCKNCHSRIDKFNKDFCPICGVEKPFEGVSSDTVEITTNIDTTNLDVDYHPRKKKTFFLLFIGLGIFGVPFFYIYKKKIAIIYMAINLVLLGGIIALLCLFTSIHPALVAVLIVLVFIAINFCVGLYMYNAPNLKDGHGDFLA